MSKAHELKRNSAHSSRKYTLGAPIKSHGGTSPLRSARSEAPVRKLLRKSFRRDLWLFGHKDKGVECLVENETGWDIRTLFSAAMLGPGHTSPQATKYKRNYMGPIIASCMHS